MNTLGTGIGLSLTHDLTLLHHGTIECQSEENVGTTFTVRFPIDKDSYKETPFVGSSIQYLHGT